MENASKALLMAAGVLIGVLILSFLAYLFSTYSASADSVQKQIELGQKQDFNNKFLEYDGRTDLTIYDINTVINMADDSNKNYGFENPTDSEYIRYLREDNYYIAVCYKNKSTQINGRYNNPNYYGVKGIISMTDINDTEYIKDVTTPYGITKELQKYTAKVELNKNTGLVKCIIFTKTNTT